MKLELTTKQFRRLLDGPAYRQLDFELHPRRQPVPGLRRRGGLTLCKAREEGMGVLAEDWQGEVVPSRAFAEAASTRRSWAI